MGNMSYCRFRNTNTDLNDCIDFIEDLNLDKEENEARIDLINKCIEVAENIQFHLDENQSVEDYFKDNEEDEEWKKQNY